MTYIRIITIMKRILLTLLAAVALTAASAQAQTSPALTSALTALNAACPTTLGPGLTCTAYEELADQGIVITLVIDESRASVDSMKAQASMLTEIFASDLASGRSPEMARLRDYCISASKPIIYRFTGSPSGTTFDVTVTPAQMKE